MTNTQIQLKTERIKEIHLENYENDFTFIVNHKEYKTSKLTSQLISPVICEMKLNDPTINMIEINTLNEGYFEKIINLNQFDKISFEENEIPFLNEIFEIFGLTIHDIFNKFDRKEKEEINNENINSNTKRHEQFKFYSHLLKEDSEYISSHF